MIALEINGLRLFMKHDRSFRFLRRFRRAQRLGRWSLRQSSEVFLEQRHRVARFDISDDCDNEIRRYVVFLEKRGGVGRREDFQVTRPADDAVVIRVREECRGDVLLDDASDGRALGAHAALFHHDVALFVELAKDRMEKALRLEIRPQLEPI